MEKDQQFVLLPPAQRMQSDNPIPAVGQRPAPQNEVSCGTLCCPNPLSCFLGCILPCGFWGSCLTVKEREEVLMLNWGKFVGTLREPGMYWTNPYGYQPITISTAQSTCDLKDVKVADAKGNPLILSGIVTYYIVDSRKAGLDVSNAHVFVSTQGLTVLKRVASVYPYESKDGHSLKGEAEQIRRQMISLLQERVDVAGIKVVNFELTDMSYAPEIAAAMLVRQQAEATVDARKVIVDGGVEIAYGAVEGLKKKGLQMPPEEATKLASNLLVVICGESKATPTVNVGGSA